MCRNILVTNLGLNNVSDEIHPSQSKTDHLKRVQLLPSILKVVFFKLKNVKKRPNYVFSMIMFI